MDGRSLWVLGHWVLGFPSRLRRQVDQDHYLEYVPSLDTYLWQIQVSALIQRVRRRERVRPYLRTLWCRVEVS